MAANDRFSYERQGVLSIAAALLAGLAAIVAIGLLARNYRADAGATIYGAGSVWFMAFAGSVLGGLALSAVGFGLGLNSAGQKRNTQSGRSWLGFFLSAAAFTATALAGLFFYFTRQGL